MRLGVFTAGAALILLLITPSGNARAHHNPGGKLPLVPNTPAIQMLQRSGEWTFCFNQRASSYPDFRNQVNEVNEAISVPLGMRWRDGGTFHSASAAQAAGCMVFHDMPDTHGCQSCAAWVFYANSPAHILYKWQLGYVSWRSTIAHETVHILGAHEGYDDLRFVSHIRTYGFWASPWNAPTVMDVGTPGLSPYGAYGVWQFTEADRRLVCGWLDPARQLFTGCGKQDPLPPPPECPGDPCWDPSGGVWHWENGWAYDPVDGTFYNPHGWPEFSGCNSDGLRWNHHIQGWMPPGSEFFDPARGWWSTAWEC